jgi:hypothetical protein
MSYITGAESFVEPEVDVVGVYKIHGSSGNRYLAEMPGHSGHSPQTYKPPSGIDAYLSLSLFEEQQAQHAQQLQKKVRKIVSMYFNKLNKVTHRKTKQREQRKGRWSASCRKIVYGGRVTNGEMTRSMSDWADQIAVESHTYIAARRMQVSSQHTAPLLVAICQRLRVETSR